MLARIIAMIVAVLLGASPATALAAMNGYDVSNWQCSINTAAVPGDFVVVGTTWGTGGFSNSCLANGVNTDANRQLQTAMSAGKRTGVYHYAMGGNPEAEAQFFVDNVRGYVGKSILVLDWEQVDNPAWGDTSWPRRWGREGQAADRRQPDHLRAGQRVLAGRRNGAVPQYRHLDRPVRVYGRDRLPGEPVEQRDARRGHAPVHQFGRAARLERPPRPGHLQRAPRSSGTSTSTRTVTCSRSRSPTPGTGSGGSAVTTEFCVTVASGDTVSGIAQRTGHLPWDRVARAQR